ncbi:MAG: putative transcriptional regulator [Armatimonadetes bacterium CSP1-3]|nr:MAG: putative transcriptional regulator [Armatimonadetes bacterium CSP1-3]
MIDVQPTRAFLVRLLQQRGGATVTDLQTTTGLSRSALRHHLTLLERDGFVRERLVRSGAGRPPIVYELVPAPERGPTESSLTLLAAIFRAVEEHGADHLEQILESVAADIAARHTYITRIPEVEARIRATLALLLEDAGAAEVNRVGSRFEIILHTCPLIGLARECNEVCEITRRLLGRLVGARVEQREWLVRGDPRCTFALRTPHSRRAAVPDARRRAG